MFESSGSQDVELTTGRRRWEPLVAALPFMWTVPNLSLADAYFEAVSGLTTTGATVMIP